MTHLDSTVTGITDHNRLHIKPQLENANLLALREASVDSSAPPSFNELLNHACTVSEYLLRPGRRQPLVLVFNPCLQVRLWHPVVWPTDGLGLAENNLPLVVVSD